jgi:hypothetical protein
MNYISVDDEGEWEKKICRFSGKGARIMVNHSKENGKCYEFVPLFGKYLLHFQSD